jgi:hypothetical protein
MKYDLDISDRVISKIEEDWRLPDSVIDELARLFDEELASDPLTHLRKAPEPGKGAEYFCRVNDRGARHLVYRFIFRVHFGPSEQSLVIYDGFLRPFTQFGDD